MFEEMIEGIRDAAILKFFGSEENLRAAAHLYTIEYGNVEVETRTDEESFITDDLFVRVSQKMRIRLKTQEELDNEV